MTRATAVFSGERQWMNKWVNEWKTEVTEPEVKRRIRVPADSEDFIPSFVAVFLPLNLFFLSSAEVLVIYVCTVSYSYLFLFLQLLQLLTVVYFIHK